MTHVLDPDALSDDARLLAPPLPPFGDVTRSDAAFRAFLHGLPGVDQVGAEARVARARHALDQDHRQGVGDRHGHLDGRPDHAGGRRHPRQGALPGRQGPRPDPSDPSCPPVAAVCVYGDLAGVAREALGGTGLHVAAVATAFPSGRASRAVKIADVQGRRRERRRRDRHGHRPRRLPHRPLPRRLRGDRRRQGGLRGRPPQGHPRDRRAGHPRQRPPRLLAGDARRRRLHQDLHRQDPARPRPCRSAW